MAADYGAFRAEFRRKSGEIEDVLEFYPLISEAARLVQAAKGAGLGVEEEEARIGTYMEAAAVITEGRQFVESLETELGIRLDEIRGSIQ